jgi:hypothetical protein
MISRITRKLTDGYWVLIYLYRSFKDPLGFIRLANDDEIKVIKEISKNNDDFEKIKDYFKKQGLIIEKREFNYIGIPELHTLSEILYYVSFSSRKGQCTIALVNGKNVSLNCTITEPSGKLKTIYVDSNGSIKGI